MYSATVLDSSNANSRCLTFKSIELKNPCIGSLSDFANVNPPVFASSSAFKEAALTLSSSKAHATPAAINANPPVTIDTGAPTPVTAVAAAAVPNPTAAPSNQA